MWFLNQLSGADQAYIVPSTFRVEAGLDFGRLEVALRALVQRHAALRTLFVDTDEGPMQCVLEPAAAAQRFQLLRVKGSLAQPDAPTLARQIAALIGQPFRVDRELPLRVLCIELGDGASIIALRVHHMVSDGLSMGILHRELASIYAAGGDASGLPPTGTTLLDAARRQRAVAAGDAWESQRRYWREELAGVQDLELVTDHPRAARSDFQAGCVRVEIDAASVEALRGLAHASGTSRFRAWLALFQLLLARMASQSDFAVGIPVGGRKDPALRDTVGMFINTLAIRLPQGFDAMGFDALLRAVDAKVLAAVEHSDCPFEKVVSDIANERSLERNPVYQAYFSFENLPDRWKLQLPGLDVSALMLPRLHISLDLSLSIEEHAHGGATATWQYRADLFEQASVERMARRFGVLLRSVVESPEAPLGDLAWYDEAERRQVLSTWNATARELPAVRTVHGLLQEHRGDATPALRDVQGRELSHAQLWRRVEQLARMLRARGAGRGRLVGLGVERGVDMVVAPLAVLRSGAAYLPLEPAFPRQRLQDMIEDAQPILLVTTQASQATWDGMPVPLLLLDVERAALDALSAEPEEPDAERDARGEDAAYVIYTSGSTGRPKGVVVPHAAVVNFLSSMRREPGLGASDRILAVTTLSFDIAVLELLLPLAVGGCAVIATREDAMDADRLRGLLEAQKITVMQATPGTWSMLVDSGWSGAPGFRALVGGESLSPELATALLGRCGEVWNMYGPTETTVWSTCWRVVPGAPVISIGRPIDNTQVYVLDAQGKPCAVGVAGEIWIGGAGVASGYFARPELTAERFVSDPWSEGGRMYRTGDRGRWLPDGLLEHRGRLDFQVKVRGYRIELGEIESRLLTHPRVRDCVVIVREDVPGDVRLVAYCVGEAPADELREHLRMTLPAYMVPQHFVSLDALPRLPNGKLDRRALPVPRDEAPARSAAAQDLNTPAERLMAAIWSELLGTPDVRRSDNFFDLGGHSLLANRAVVEFAARGGRRIELRRLIFESLGQLVVGVELGAQLAGDAHAAVGEPTPEAPARGPAAWLRRLLGR